jgi:hypothetical protein
VKKNHPVHTAWQNMKQRCFNENHPKFHRYGGRGIIICQNWLNSKNFAEWAFLNGWQKGLTLDRIHNDEDYTPENCQWILWGLNSRKKSTTKLTIGKAKEIRVRKLKGEDEHHLASEYGVCHGTIWFILNKMTWNEEL